MLQYDKEAFPVVHQRAHVIKASAVRDATIVSNGRRVVRWSCYLPIAVHSEPCISAPLLRLEPSRSTSEAEAAAYREQLARLMMSHIKVRRSFARKPVSDNLQDIATI